MKKFISLMLCMFMLITMLCPVLALAEDTEEETPVSGTTIIYIGDANGDKLVNTADATVILKHCSDFVLITDSINLIAADANQNGELNTADATTVLKHCAGMIELGTITIENPEPTQEPTEEPTVEPTDEPTEEPTVEPTEEPTEEPTVEPTIEPTEEPTTPPVEANYFYGNSYRDADMNIVYSETIVEDARPMNVFKASEDKGATVTLQHSLLNGQTITRTFETTGEEYTYEGETFVQVVETTNWANVPGVRPVEKVAGTKASNSVSLASLQNTSNTSVLGTDFSRIMYVLIEDIDWNGANWTAIGGGGAYYTSFFYSYFDGMGYAVNRIKCHLSVSGSDSSYVSTAGFFGKVNGGGVANLIVPNADVRLMKPASGINMYSSVGIISGQAYNAKFINCHTSGYVDNQYSPWGSGGIVGYTQTIYDNYHQGYCSFSQCSSTANIYADRSATAGIIGKCIGPYNTVDQSWYNGTIASDSNNVGGIIGWVSDTSVPPVVTNCWSAGKYYGVCNSTMPSYTVCGLIGSTVGSVSNCYTTAYIYIQNNDPSMGHPSFKAPASFTYYMTGRYFIGSSYTVNMENDEFVSFTFSGYLTTGYTTAYGGTGVSSTEALAMVATGTSDIWATAGVYPQLIEVYGRPSYE